MRLYHVTDAADSIIRDGFRDSRGTYMLATLTLEGVFVSDEPLSIHEGAKGDQVLRIELDDDVNLEEFELIEDDKPYREWCVPSSLLNLGSVVLLSEDETDELAVATLRRRYRDLSTGSLDADASTTPTARSDSL